jgi:hypothetical protein
MDGWMDGWMATNEVTVQAKIRFFCTEYLNSLNKDIGTAHYIIQIGLVDSPQRTGGFRRSKNVVALCLTKHHAMKTYLGCGGMVSLIL